MRGKKVNLLEDKKVLKVTHSTGVEKLTRFSVVSLTIDFVCHRLAKVPVLSRTRKKNADHPFNLFIRPMIN